MDNKKNSGVDTFKSASQNKEVIEAEGAFELPSDEASLFEDLAKDDPVQKLERKTTVEREKEAEKIIEERKKDDVIATKTFIARVEKTMSTIDSFSKGVNKPGIELVAAGVFLVLCGIMLGVFFSTYQASLIGHSIMYAVVSFILGNNGIRKMIDNPGSKGGEILRGAMDKISRTFIGD